MTSIEGGSLGEYLSTPLVLSVPVAGALAALFAILFIVALWRTRGGGAGRLLAVVALVIGVLAVAALIDRMTVNEHSAERRALTARDAELSRAALAPGSALSCLDARAGEAVENACEKAVFADAQSAAAAVSYMAARIDLLRDAAAFAKARRSEVLAEFAASRRAIELDRFGVAAHVLASREGCTAADCTIFTLLNDTNALKSNLKARVFDQYVARHTPEWNAPPVDVPPAMAASPAPDAPAAATAASTPRAPLSDKYDFPSAASIPPVSIMNAEPPVPADTNQDAAASPQTAGNEAAPAPPTPRSKPPQGQTSPAPAR